MALHVLLPEVTTRTTEQYIDVFSALSESARVTIVRMIAQEDGRDLPCTALDSALPIAKSTISYHVQILRRAGLITVRKSGRNYFYQLQPATFETYVPGLLEHLLDSDHTRSELLRLSEFHGGQ